MSGKKKTGGESRSGKKVMFHVFALLIVVFFGGVLLLKSGVISQENLKLSKNMPPWLFLGVVSALALADSINPCMISVMVMMIAGMVALGLERKGVVTRAAVFTLTCYVTYFVLGVAIYLAYSYLRFMAIALNGFNVMKALLVIALLIAGVVNVFDALKGKKSAFSIPDSAKNTIHRLMLYVSFTAVVLLAIFVTIVELPCTGLFYLGLISFLHSTSSSFGSVVMILIYYCFLFVLPEILITLLVYSGREPKAIYEKIYNKHRREMRFVEGIALIVLAILVWVFVSIG